MPPATPPSTSSSPAGERWIRFAVIGVMLLVIWVRWRHASAPLERDEGEYAVAGSLLLEGVAPYRELYNMKLPGIYAVYAGVLALFGSNASGIHLGLALANALACGLVFLIGRRFFGPLGGAVALGWFALVSLTRAVQGAFANAEHFLLVPALLGWWLVHPARERARPLLAGLALGTAFVIKQHGLFFGVVGFAWLLIGERRRAVLGWRRPALFAAGSAVPYLVVCLWMWSAGVFDTFWRWTFEYARAYTSQVDASAGLELLGKRVEGFGRDAGAAWIAALLGLVALAFHRPRSNALALATAFVACAAAASTGLYFRPHYFVLLLPAAAWLAAGLLAALPPRLPRFVPTATALALLGATVFANRRDWFELSPTELTRATFGLNPFPESVALGAFLAEHTEPDDTIAVLGSEPQLYFYADRRPATGYVYTYALMEAHPFAEEMQREMAAELAAAEPELVVFVNVSTSWLKRPDSTMWIFGWMDRFLVDYERIAFLDVRDPQGLRTGPVLPSPEAAARRDGTLTVLRRKP